MHAPSHQLGLWLPVAGVIPNPGDDPSWNDVVLILIVVVLAVLAWRWYRG